MTNRAPFKHKGAPRRGSGEKYFRGAKLTAVGGNEGANFQLCFRAPKLMTHWTPVCALLDTPLLWPPGPYEEY